MKENESKRYHDMAFAEKGNYLKFIHDIGEKGLREKFAFPGENFSIWWFSRTAEKSPQKSNSYKDLISLLAFGEPKGSGGGLFRSLRRLGFIQFLAGLCRYCKFIYRAVHIKISMKMFGSRRKGLAGQRYYIFSYFPLIDETAAEKGIFENLYLASFHRILEKNYPGQYSHIVFQTDMNGYDLKGSIELANRFAKRQSIFFLEEFFSPSHIFKLFFYYIYFSFVFLKNVGWIRRHMVYEHNGKTYDVWRIFRDDLYQSFCGAGLVSSLWHILLFEEAVKPLNTSGKIVAICEMQSWERVLYSYAKKRGITTIGIQHTIVPELLLNYFNDPREIGSADFLKHCPFPDYVATVGRTSMDIFKKNGWPKERVFVWGAQRFESLKTMAESPVPWQGKENYFVCIFSVNASEIEKLLLLIKNAFSTVKDYRIIIKPHPTENLQKHIRRAGLDLDASVFHYTNEPLEDVVRKAKGIIAVSSSSCLYALACNIPVIIPVFPDRIDYNPLSYRSDVPVYVYSADDLRSVCDRIIAAKDSPCAPDAHSDFLKDYLHFPEDKSEYVEKIAAL